MAFVQRRCAGDLGGGWRANITLGPWTGDVLELHNHEADVTVRFDRDQTAALAKLFRDAEDEHQRTSEEPADNP